MRKVLAISEIVRDLDREAEPRELCAAADADYDDASSTLIVSLDSFVRQVRHAAPDVCTRPEWLPKGEVLREKVPVEEASDLARDIFQRWTRKVRDSGAAVPGAIKA